MNSHVTTTFKRHNIWTRSNNECIFETVITGSWIMVCHKISNVCFYKLYHKDLHKLPTGYTRVSDSLTLSSSHLCLMKTRYELHESVIYNVTHTVDDAISSEDIFADDFYTLFHRFKICHGSPKYMRVTAAFTDLKFDF